MSTGDALTRILGSIGLQGDALTRILGVHRSTGGRLDEDPGGP